jgi:hypothetical protein
LSWVGLVQDIRTPSKAVLGRNLIRDGNHDVGILGKPREALEAAGLELSVGAAQASASK